MLEFDNLFSLEGLDGSGKATQTKSLLKKLKNKERSAYLISFPNYESQSSALVKMYLNSEVGESSDPENAYAVSSFFAVDRYVSFVKSWKKLYEKGHIIIADRYTTSNAVYQLSSLKRAEWDFYLEWLFDYEYNKLGLPRPKLVIFLDMPVKKCQELILKRYNGDESKKDLYEKNIEKLYKCREAAFYVSKKFGWKTVKCTEEKTGQVRTVEDISKDIFKMVMDVIN